MNDRRSAWLFGLAGLFALGQWVVVGLWPAENVAPLHYTIYFGIDLTGPSWQRYLLPAVATLIVVIHGIFSRLQSSTLWSRLWAVTALLFVVVLSATLATLRIATFQ